MPDAAAPAEELTALQAEVRELREAVDALRGELRRAQQRVDLTMRGQLRCRACGCRQIAHALRVLDRSDGVTRDGLALYQPSWWSNRAVGELEAYICTRCGQVEWWIKDPASLVEHANHIEILDGDRKGEGPYR